MGSMTAYELTGLQRTYLDTVRERVSKEDGPAHDLAADLTPEGEVKFRPATLSDQLDRIVATWLLAQADEAAGEVE